MTVNKFKVLFLAASFMGLVACGKNDNNLKIDGEYKIDDVQASDEESALISKTNNIELVEIKNNEATFITMSADKKNVEIKKEKLTVKGRMLVKSETIMDQCADVKQASSSNDKLSYYIDIQKGNLSLVSDNVSIKLTKMDSEEFKVLVKDAVEGKVQRACLDASGKVLKKLDTAAVVAEEKAIEETKAEEQAQEEKSEKADQAESDKSTTDEKTSENEAVEASDKASSSTEESSTADNNETAALETAVESTL